MKHMIDDPQAAWPGHDAYIKCLDRKCKEVAETMMDACRPQWIPVTERLPIQSEHPGGVLVWQKFDRDIYGAWDGHHVAEYREKTGEWREFVESNAIRNVTHWMPLPEPPAAVAEQT
jgi:hypothetical protein